MKTSDTFKTITELTNKRFRPERTFSDNWNAKRRYRLS